MAFASFTAAKSAYLANADYAETGDALKAGQFVTPCRSLLVLLPSVHQTEEQSTEFNLPAIRLEKEAAEQWIRENGVAPRPTPATPVRSRTTVASFERFR